MKNEEKKVKCNKCDYIGELKEFPQQRDLFQNLFVAGCPKCNNRQNLGDASLRMMPGMEHPFSFVTDEPDIKVADKDSAFRKVMRDAGEAS